MAKIAFILLAHKDPEGVIAQARRLTATGDFLSIHYDARASRAEFASIRAALADNPRVTFAARRYRCGWGQWSLVAATLSALRAAIDAFPAASHVYMLSGDCLPIKSAAYAHAFLDREDADYIESFDFFESDWIKTGFRGERLHYRHWFNERTQSRLFYAAFEVQRRLGLTRTVPAGMRVMIGSQWWCLRRDTVEKILTFADARPDVVRFFRTTWIPDETFFQTLVPHLVPRTEIRRRALTFLIFTDYGLPVTFHDDHLDLLLGEDALFARKVSAGAVGLRAALAEVWADDAHSFAVSDTGAALYRLVAAQGRHGRRFGPRFWEEDAQARDGRALLLIVAKTWHHAKALTSAIRAGTDIAALDYLFNEAEAGLPDLGGIETTVEKRTRHRRALIRLLFDAFATDRLVLCLDPHASGLVTDLIADGMKVRLLLIETRFDDAYVGGHIRRLGLASRGNADNIVRDLTPAVTAELEREADIIRRLPVDDLAILDPRRPVAANVAALSGFLDIAPELAARILATPQLLDD